MDGFIISFLAVSFVLLLAGNLAMAFMVYTTLKGNEPKSQAFAGLPLFRKGAKKKPVILDDLELWRREMNEKGGDSR